MRVLSFETATYSGGVAFVAPGIRDCAGPFEPRAASREILAAAAALLEKHGCACGDLDLVAVSTGPGLFTGVRAGLSIAKTLVWARGGGKPALAGVPTLEAVASLVTARRTAGARPGEGVVAVTDARRGEVYAALFRIGERENAESLRLERVSEDVVARPGRLTEGLFSHPAARDLAERPVWLAGDGAHRYRDLLTSLFGDRGRFFPRAEGCLSVQVAELGIKRFLAGRLDSPETLRPHYVRRPDARPAAIPPA